LRILRLAINLRVHEDVVRVQLHVEDRDLRQSLVRHNTGDRRTAGQHGGIRDPSANALDGQSGGGTGSSASRLLLLNGKLQPQVAGGGEQNVGLLLSVNGDKTLPVRDRYGSNSLTAVLVNDYTKLQWIFLSIVIVFT